MARFWLKEYACGYEADKKDPPRGATPLVFMWIPWSGLHGDSQASEHINVATATKRSPRLCGAQLDPSHGTGAWAPQEL